MNIMKFCVKKQRRKGLRGEWISLVVAVTAVAWGEVVTDILTAND